MTSSTSFAPLANFAAFWKRGQNAPILHHVPMSILKQLVISIYPKLLVILGPKLVANLVILGPNLVILGPKLVANLVILILDFKS